MIVFYLSLLDLSLEANGALILKIMIDSSK